MAVKVVIREEFEIDLCDTEEQLKTITVRELMERIAEREGAAESERIILCDGEKLEDDRRLSDCGVKHMSVLQMRRRVRGGASPVREPGAGGMGEKEYKRKSESEQTISFDGEKFGGDPPLSSLPCWQQTKESYFPRGSTPDREPGAGGMGENEYKRKRETESEQTMLYDGENLNDERLQLEEAMYATSKRRRKINRRRGFRSFSRDCLIDPEEPRSGDSCPGATPEQEPGAGGMGDKKGKNRKLIDRQLICTKYRSYRHTNTTEMVVSLVLIDPRCERIVIGLCDTEEQFKTITVRELRRKVFQSLPDYDSDDLIRLMFTCNVLDDDDRCLSDYGIQHMSIIQMFIHLPGGGGPVPEPGAGGMGDRDGRNKSMDRLADFRCPQQQFQKNN